LNLQTTIAMDYQAAHTESLQMLEARHNVTRILSYLAEAADNVGNDDTVSSILLLDKNGLLRNGASPRLPFDYLKAIDGIKPNPTIGTCAAAVATRSMVITLDFQEDAKWAELRHLPLALGFKSAFSIPIVDSHQKVLGTFGTYFKTKRLPTLEEIDGVKLLANAAAEAIQASV
jgi:GAF domain-containing protein